MGTTSCLRGNSTPGPDIDELKLLERDNTAIRQGKIYRCYRYHGNPSRIRQGSLPGSHAFKVSTPQHLPRPRWGCDPGTWNSVQVVVIKDQVCIRIASVPLPVYRSSFTDFTLVTLFPFKLRPVGVNLLLRWRCIRIQQGKKWRPQAARGPANNSLQPISEQKITSFVGIRFLFVTWKRNCGKSKQGDLLEVETSWAC